MSADKLIEEFKKSLEVIPYLAFEIGYTRITGWMVHVWDSSVIGLKSAPLIIECQGYIDECFTEAIEKIKEYVIKKTGQDE